MPATLSVLETTRDSILRQIPRLGDLRPGSIVAAFRRCGKPTCHCAQPNDPGHGPGFQLTYKVKGKTVTENLPTRLAVGKAEREVEEFRKFQQLSGQLVEVNQRICRLRPVEGADRSWSAEEKKRLLRSIRRSRGK